MKGRLAALRAYLFEEKHRRIMELAALALIVALIVALCISINMREDMHRRYLGVRDHIGADVYANLNLMSQTFDMANVPEADIQHGILPQMKELFYGAVALNQLLRESYSEKYALLTDADVAGIESAFSAFDTAFRTEGSTDLAQSDMQNCVTRVRELLNTRYVSGVLKPTR